MQFKGLTTGQSVSQDANGSGNTVNHSDKIEHSLNRICICKSKFGSKNQALEVKKKISWQVSSPGGKPVHCVKEHIARPCSDTPHFVLKITILILLGTPALF